MASRMVIFLAPVMSVHVCATFILFLLFLVHTLNISQLSAVLPSPSLIINDSIKKLIEIVQELGKTSLPTLDLNYAMT